MRTPQLALIALVTAIIVTMGLPAGAQNLDALLVQDINPTPADQATDPEWLTPVGSLLFFTAYTDRGRELWATDGTPDGAYLVRDINPGESSAPSSLVAVGDTLFFAAYETTDRELWRSDGTEEGTVRVHGISPGGMTAVGDDLFFVASDGEHGAELWTSDGTEAGTGMVVDLNPGPGHSGIGGLVDVGGTLYFGSRIGTSGSDFDLWMSDGTAAGTVPVVEFGPGSNSSIRSLFDLDGVLYFVATSDGDTELWRHDPSTGDTVEIDINPNGGSFPNELTEVGGILFLRATVDFDTELYRLDGDTPVLVRNIHPTASSTPNRLIEVTSGGDSTLFFFADDGVHGRELWRSDGTEAGTVFVDDLNPTGDAVVLGSIGGFSGAVAADVNGTLFFRAGSYFDYQLWLSDGTPAGTNPIDIFPGGQSIPHWIVNFDDAAFLVARDSIDGITLDDFTLNFGLWRSDGTPEGTVRVGPPIPGRTQPSYVSFQHVMGTTLFFLANDQEVVLPPSDGSDIPTDYELWRTDGTEAGTHQVADINPDGSGFPLNSGATSFAELDGILLFRATDGPTGWELWRSDGTEEGTFLVRDIDPDSGPEDQGSGPFFLTTVGDRVLFAADDGVTGNELWRTDGTEAGTELVADIRPGSSGSFPIQHGLNVAGTLFFTANDGVSGTELWRSDGTAEGTTMVRDMQPGGGSSSLWDFTDLDGTLFFRRSTGLWRSDGTEEGTFQIPGVSGVAGIAAVDGVLYLSATGAGTGRELWRHDPVTGVSELVADIHPDGDSYPADIMEFDGAIFFTADSGEGRGLWRFDTATGISEPIAEFGLPGVGVQNPVAIGGALYFTANDGGPFVRRARHDLWTSDGTAAGTVRMDFDLGLSLSPSFLTDVGGTVFFSGYLYETGSELFRLGLLGVGPSIAITSPADDEIVGATEVLVEGTATDDGAIVSVSVNGVDATLVSTENPDDPTEVFFSALVSLQDGVNEVVATAVDDDGSASEAVIFVESSVGGPLPDCSTASPSHTELWPPNHKMILVSIVGLLDDQGEPIEAEITGVTSDEPPLGPGKHHDPDAIVLGNGAVLLRAERLGGGNGRVYEIHFTATTDSGTCSGSIQVSVPHDQSGDVAVDDGQFYDATEAD